MVYVEQNTGELVVIPRHSPSISRQFDLKLINNLTNEMIVYPNVTSTSKNEKLYCFEVNTDDLNDGEYTYFVFQKDKNMDTGLLRVFSNEETTPVSYEKEENIVTYNG